MVDTSLILRCQKGDVSAFEELYKFSSAKAFRTVYSMVNRTDLAEDIIQEAFYECFRDISKLHAPEAFEVWFYRILVRICWRMMSDERRSSHEELEDCGNGLKDPRNYFDDIESSVLIDAINRLSLAMRTTVILHYYNDMSVKEIARIMNCFEGTVKSRLFNSRKILEKELKKQLRECSGRGNMKGVLERGVSFDE